MLRPDLFPSHTDLTIYPRNSVTLNPNSFSHQSWLINQRISFLHAEYLISTIYLFEFINLTQVASSTGFPNAVKILFFWKVIKGWKK